VIDNLYCEADLSSLTDETTFNLEQGAEVVAIVAAANANGFGLFSLESASGALIVTTPEAPAQSPVRDSAASTESSVSVLMPYVSSDQSGGLSLISYQL
jgi:hypothetical protein